ncbi:MAG: DNA-directed RNA polymerase subunit A', partial [Candidatus Methanomethylophilus sp.]|nr:DNA-directed RNA polymerase subunit A' [Methanomethylophilus sp.]
MIYANGITKRINGIRFASLSPDEIRRMSAVKVITADTYDDEGYPIDGGLMDRHMGVVERGLKCATCGARSDDCPGHFGHIDLARPIIHVGFIKEIETLLKCTCGECGRLMLTDEQKEKRTLFLESVKKLGGDSDDVYKYAKETAKLASKNAFCPHCGAEVVKIKLDKPTTFHLENEDKTKLTAQDVRDRLERIPEDDLVILGIDPKACRPEWMVLQALPVPPVTVRPSIRLESDDRSEDDLTHKLVDIIRINQRLRENRDQGAPQLIVEDLWELLQYHVTTYFDNQVPGIPPARHRSGRPLKTLTQRLKGKEGRFRSNLSGKRVNFSARTVISPDPLLSINEVGVPVAAARELTVPVCVNENNIEYMRSFLMRGPVAFKRFLKHDEEGNEYYDCEAAREFLNARNAEIDMDKDYLPGVNYVIRDDGRRIKIRDSNVEFQAENLNIGYVIERQLTDGDVVLFNRQPSLHRMSMMAHRVRIMAGKTFRFNLCVCPPYNADFDGDEMNLHVLQSEEARAEARIIMQVQEHILSPRYGGPIIGAIHDHITGAYFLTHEGDGNLPRFDRFEAMNILSKIDNVNPDADAEERDEIGGITIPEPQIDENGNEYWTGKQLFSTILPKDFSTTFKAAICHGCKDGCKKENCPYDAYVKIRNGQLLMGTIDVKGIGNSKGKILDKVARDYGANRARKFINQVTRLALGTIMNHGFSTGIDDEDIPEQAKSEILDYNNKCVEEVEGLIQSYRDGTLNQMPGRSLEETLEAQVQNKLGDARDNAGRIAGEHLGMQNSAVIMAKSGARGSMLNLSQMAGCVGQQTVRNERLRRGYHYRTLPHFEPNDLGAYAKGFVTNSY